MLVDLNPTIGSEIKKTRPCVVISPNEMNRHLQTIVIAPLTSTSKAYPSRVAINHGKTKGWVVLDQIRAVDRQRIIKQFEQLSEEESKSIKQIIKETYVD